MQPNTDPKRTAWELPTDEQIQKIVFDLFKLYPRLVPNQKNLLLISDWLEAHNAQLTLENCSKAVMLLSYADGEPTNCKFDWQDPAPATPPPVASAEPVEVLAPGEISIFADRWELEQASTSQLRSYLIRAKKAGMR